MGRTQSRPAGRLLAEIVPGGVICAESVGEGEPDTALLAEESAALGRAGQRRRMHFATGRACARHALGELGLPPAPILRGARREPRWPAGVVGSITHCRGYGAAAVAWKHRVAAIGIDAEPHEALADGVLDRVALAPEREWIAAGGAGPVHFDRVLFSAKESVYKAWYPLTGAWLGFADALITFDPDQHRFHARILVPGQTDAGAAITGFQGRYLVRDGLVLTAATLAGAADPGEPAGPAGVVPRLPSV